VPGRVDELAALQVGAAQLGQEYLLGVRGQQRRQPRGRHEKLSVAAGEPERHQDVEDALGQGRIQPQVGADSPAFLRLGQQLQQPGLQGCGQGRQRPNRAAQLVDKAPHFLAWIHAHHLFHVDLAMEAPVVCVPAAREAKPAWHRCSRKVAAPVALDASPAALEATTESPGGCLGHASPSGPLVLFGGALALRLVWWAWPWPSGGRRCLPARCWDGVALGGAACRVARRG
jgi:hypothetical protein